MTAESIIYLQVDIVAVVLGTLPLAGVGDMLPLEVGDTLPLEVEDTLLPGAGGRQLLVAVPVDTVVVFPCLDPF